MARIGLRNFRYSILTEAADGTPSYDGAKTPAHAISSNVQIQSSSAKLYGDDVQIESGSVFTSGTITIGIDDDDTEVMAELLGHNYDSQTGKLVRNADDIAPYVGFGRIITKMVDGAYKYKVEFLYKVQFSEPNQENATKGENLEFGTHELQGTISALANGNWSESKTFTSATEAVTYLEGLMQ